MEGKVLSRSLPPIPPPPPRNLDQLVYRVTAPPSGCCEDCPHTVFTVRHWVQPISLTQSLCTALFNLPNHLSSQGQPAKSCLRIKVARWKCSWCVFSLSLGLCLWQPGFSLLGAGRALKTFSPDLSTQLYSTPWPLYSFSCRFATIQLKVTVDINKFIFGFQEMNLCKRQNQNYTLGRIVNKYKFNIYGYIFILLLRDELFLLAAIDDPAIKLNLFAHISLDELETRQDDGRQLKRTIITVTLYRIING